MSRAPHRVAAVLIAVALTGTVSSCSTTPTIPALIVAPERAAIDRPAGLPTAVPLVGVLVAAAPVGPEGWSVTTVVASEAEHDSVLDALGGAGFRGTGIDESDPTERHYSFASADWLVSVTLRDQGGDRLVLYSIAPRS